MITITKRMTHSGSVYRYTVIARVPGTTGEQVHRVSSSLEDRTQAEAECVTQLQSIEASING